jgi:hypothetical protein
MTEEPYKTPEAELESSSQGIPREIKRPWAVYFMALWSFFGITGFLTTAIRVLSQGNQEVLQIGSLAILVFAVILIIYILQMRRYFIVVFALLCILLALWQTFNLIDVLLSENPGNPIIYLLFFYIVPSVILATLALKPRFLELADNYRKFKHFESMQKASVKAMRR